MNISLFQRDRLGRRRDEGLRGAQEVEDRSLQ
jgi:hypothetical protein